jgi:hypothetical protein
MLSDVSPNPQSALEPPALNFGASRSPSSTSLNSNKEVSLSVNYLPSKFSRPHSPGLHKRRKGEKDDDFYPKRGGGRDAFRSNESRMPGANDEDYDGVTGGWASSAKGRLRWNRFKWILFFSNTLVSFTPALPLHYANLITPTAHNLFPRLPDILPPHSVQCLESCRCCKSWKFSRTFP